MSINPIRLSIETEEAKKLENIRNKYTLPIHVCCILDEYSDFDDIVLHGVRDYCIKKNLLFTTRLYDSTKYNCDRDYIERLPAFHIFMNRLHMKTYYPNTRPLQHIDEILDLYLKRENAKQQKKHLWNKKIREFIEWLKSLVYRKTRMEKYNDEQIDWSIRAPKPMNVLFKHD